MARLQAGAVTGRAVAALVGVCPRRPGRPACVVVLAAGPAAPRVQPQDRLPGARQRPQSPQAALAAELPQPRQGLRRPDAAAEGEGRDDAAAAEGKRLGVSRGGAGAGQGRSRGVLPHGLVRGGGGDLVGHPGADELEPRALFEWYRDTRARLGISVLTLDHGGIRKVLEALSDQEMVITAIDRDITGTGYLMPFFGRMAPIPLGPAAIALRLGTPLFPV